MTKNLVFIAAWALTLCLPLFVFAHTTFPRLNTDYDSNLPVYQYIVSFIWTHHTVPLNIPVVASGIPFWGDPLNSFLNPLLSVPLTLFGINFGLRLAIYLNVLFSGISMFILLQSQHVEKKLAHFGAFLYMSGGAFFAAVASGHIEKFLVYPLVPFLAVASLREKMQWRWALLTGVIISLTIYSGDLYNTWFFLLIFFTVRTYYFFGTKNKISEVFYDILVLAFFIVLSSPKLYPFAVHVIPTMQRFNEINPFKGSLQFFFFPLTFFMPFGEWFWDRPFFQRHFGFYFNWYEYFAFITPFPFLFLTKIKYIIKRKSVKSILLVLLVGILYFSLAYPYSPFFWLFRFTTLENFIRVPQRIVLPMTAFIILLCTMCAQVLVNQSKAKIVYLICGLTLVWMLFVDWNIILQTFTTTFYPQQGLIRQFAQMNGKKISVTDFAQSTQLFLVENGISIQNYYYGWVPKGTETYNESPATDYVKLISSKPQFVITSHASSLLPYGYKIILKNSTIAIWKRAQS